MINLKALVEVEVMVMAFMVVVAGLHFTTDTHSLKTGVIVLNGIIITTKDDMPHLFIPMWKRDPQPHLQLLTTLPQVNPNPHDVPSPPQVPCPRVI
jgi:hypothetical protein